MTASAIARTTIKKSSISNWWDYRGLGREEMDGFVTLAPVLGNSSL
jgi:hypothetical protein